jgi:hypothetical protein
MNWVLFLLLTSGNIIVQPVDFKIGSSEMRCQSVGYDLVKNPDFSHALAFACLPLDEKTIQRIDLLLKLSPRGY